MARDSSSCLFLVRQTAEQRRSVMGLSGWKDRTVHFRCTPSLDILPWQTRERTFFVYIQQKGAAPKTQNEIVSFVLFTLQEYWNLITIYSSLQIANLLFASLQVFCSISVLIWYSWLCCCRSNLYIDGIKVVNNDYPQWATERCASSAIHLEADNHTVYVEGWSRSAYLSVTATYQGADTQNIKMAIPGFKECDPNGPSRGDGNFTICGYRADNSINLGSVDQFFAYHSQACSKHKIWIFLELC